MVATDIAARGIHVDGIDLVIHADPPAEHKAYVHRSGRTARGGADGVVVTLQMRSQAREVTAMMRKAGIAPRTAAAYDPESDVLREIGGPPAPRVSVSGKVSELVRPEDRLAANAAGGPGGRGGYGRGGGGRPRDDRPRRDRPGGGRYGSDRNGSDRYTSDRPAPARDFAPRDRDERPARFARDDRPARFDGDRGSDRGPRAERDRNDRPADDNRAPRGEFRRDERPYGDRPAGGGRSFGDRPSSAGRPFRGDRDNRNAGGQRPERNDWWPRENRPASGNGPAASTAGPARLAAGDRPGPARRTARPAATGPSATAGTASRAARTATDRVAATARRRPADRARPGAVPAIRPGATGAARPGWPPDPTFLTYLRWQRARESDQFSGRRTAIRAAGWGRLTLSCCRTLRS